MRPKRGKYIYIYILKEKKGEKYQG